MATVTPNYSWPVPTSTDLVKDGATAIEALGDAIDATVFGLPSSGLVLVKSQVIGTTVSSVAVTSAFSATYDNYKILISGGVSSTNASITLQLGATTTGYYAGLASTSYAGTVTAAADSNAAAFTLAGYASTGGISFNTDLQSVFLTKNTIANFNYAQTATGGSARVGSGYLNNSTSYTDFTLTPSTGTLTGGTIRVYGYKN